jgi:probable phosphomutase (TIGR03848 family)
LTTFLLVRHASHDLMEGTLAGHMPGVYLSAQGQQQAQQMADRMAALPIVAIYSSPLARTLQTAAPLASRLNLPVQASVGFAEIDFGEWTGKRFDELAADPRWRDWNTFRSSSGLPNSGLMLEVQVRAVATVQGLCQQHPDQVVVIVSHSDVIKAVIAHYMGVHLDLFQRIEISPASISLIAVSSWGARVIRLNDTGDLLPLP